MIDLTPIFEAMIALLASVITLKVIPWLKAKTDKQQQDYLLSTAKVQVYAAEQLYGAGNGDAKLQYVEDELEARGFKVDSAAIESAVRQMNLIESWDAVIELEGEQDGSEE